MKREQQWRRMQSYPRFGELHNPTTMQQYLNIEISKMQPSKQTLTKV